MLFFTFFLQVIISAKIEDLQKEEADIPDIPPNLDEYNYEVGNTVIYLARESDID